VDIVRSLVGTYELLPMNISQVPPLDAGRRANLDGWAEAERFGSVVGDSAKSRGRPVLPVTLLLLIYSATPPSCHHKDADNIPDRAGNRE
jgi:hypothetical protein